jgi:hypothetical protein
MKAYGGSGYKDPCFLGLGTSEGEWSAPRPSRFTPGERAPSTHWTGAWVGPRTSLDHMEKRKFLTLPGMENG